VESRKEEIKGKLNSKKFTANATCTAALRPTFKSTSYGQTTDKTLLAAAAASLLPGLVSAIRP